MTTDPSGPARPGRLVGLALMGVAAVAAVIGVVTLVGGNGDSSAEPAPSSSATAPAPPSGDLTSSPAATSSSSSTSSEVPSSAAPTTTTAPPVTTTTTTAPPAPPATTAAPAPNVRTEPVRVYNNSTIKGLAERAAGDVAATGWTVAMTGNYSGGNVPVSTIYFQPGTGQEAAAQQFAKDFGIRAEPRFDGIKDASPGLIFIVTKDYKAPAGK